MKRSSHSYILWTFKQNVGMSLLGFGFSLLGEPKCSVVNTSLRISLKWMRTATNIETDIKAWRRRRSPAADGATPTENTLPAEHPVCPQNCRSGWITSSVHRILCLSLNLANKIVIPVSSLHFQLFLKLLHSKQSWNALHTEIRYWSFNPIRRAVSYNGKFNLRWYTTQV